MFFIQKTHSYKCIGYIILLARHYSKEILILSQSYFQKSLLFLEIVINLERNMEMQIPINE